MEHDLFSFWLAYKLCKTLAKEHFALSVKDHTKS